jgi:basic membrane protein A and related proteins
MKDKITLRRTLGSLSLAVVAAVALGACGSSNSSNTTTSAPATTAPSGTGTTVAPSGHPFLACEVTDTGGINDRSFNASAYAGLEAAAAINKNITYKYLGSTSTSDYTPNINTFLSEGCGIIITVGFDMGNATETAAKAHPTQKFAIVDFNYTPNIPNILGLTYQTNQSAFLGGYLAAAMSKPNGTASGGAVGTFGGQNIPPVTIYMDGFVAGVRYYDQLNHKSVKALGWDPAAGNRSTGNFNGSGLFTNNFTDDTLGATDTRTLLSQGASVIFPVAGAVGLGAASAVSSANKAGASDVMEWVDVDGCVSAPQYCSLFITSVEKGILTSVKDAVLAAAGGTFAGGTYVGTLKNGGVGIAPFHDFASTIPGAVQSELTTLQTGIENGTISVDPTKYPAP